MAPKKIRKLTRRKKKKEIKKVLPKIAPVKKVNTVWRNPEFHSQLCSKLNIVAAQRQIQESAGPRLIEYVTQSANTSDLECEIPDFKIKRENVNQRHKALAIIHNQFANLEVRFQKDVLELENLYTRKFYGPLFSLRKTLLDLNPRNQDTVYDKALLDSCQISFTPPSDEFADLRGYVDGLLASNDKHFTEPCKEFWPNVLLRADPIVRQMIHQGDIDILKSLKSVKTEPAMPQSIPMLSESYETNPCAADASLGFTIRFEFLPNNYFSNDVLYKSFTIDLNPVECEYVIMSHRDVMMRDDDCDADAEDSDEGSSSNSPSCDHIPMHLQDRLLDYRGPKVVSAIGSVIHWMATDPESRLEREKKKSFFDFFNSVDESCADYRKQLARDYGIGCYFKNVLVPRAYLYYRRKDLKEGDKKVEEEVSEPQPAEETVQSQPDVMRESPVTIQPVTDDVVHTSEKVERDVKTTSLSREVNTNYDDVDDEIPDAMSEKALSTMCSDPVMKSEIRRNNLLARSKIATSRLTKLMGNSDIINRIASLDNLVTFDGGTNDVDDEVTIKHPSRDVPNDVDVDDVLPTKENAANYDAIPLQSAGQATADSSMMRSVSASRERMANVVQQVNQLLMEGNSGVVGASLPFDGPLYPSGPQFGSTLAPNKVGDFIPSPITPLEDGASDNFAWSPVEDGLPPDTGQFELRSGMIVSRRFMDGAPAAEVGPSRSHDFTDSRFTLFEPSNQVLVNDENESGNDMISFGMNSSTMKSDSRDSDFVLTFTPGTSKDDELDDVEPHPSILNSRTTLTDNDLFKKTQPQPTTSLLGKRKLKENDLDDRTPPSEEQS